MNKSLEKFLTVIIIIQMLLLPILSIDGVQSVIASRVSEIIEVTPDVSGPYQPDSTLFGIEVEVEILNRDNENQTVIELTDLNSDVFINASFVNQSLHIDQLSYGAAIITRYSYQPGIAVEFDLVKFYINQSGLSQLPDGNYTLWRPIFIEIASGNITAGETLLTIFSMTAGVMKITYSSFDYQPTDENQNTDGQPSDEVNLQLLVPLVFILLLSYVSVIYRRKKSRIT